MEYLYFLLFNKYFFLSSMKFEMLHSSIKCLFSVWTVVKKVETLAIFALVFIQYHDG